MEKISKVDSDGMPISQFKVWKSRNPDAVYFDSMLEYKCNKYLELHKIKNTPHPTIVLAEGKRVSEFKKKRGSKDFHFINSKIENIKYTPDFYLEDFGIYIEVKGFATPEFRLRWRLFKLLGYKGYIVFNLKQLDTVIKKLQEDVGNEKTKRTK